MQEYVKDEVMQNKFVVTEQIAKCPYCNLEIKFDGYDTSKVAYGIMVVTNSHDVFVPPDKFEVIYAFWNHKLKKQFYICGACFTERLGLTQ